MLVDIFTAKNLDILNILFQQSLYIREIAEKLGCSVAKVHEAVQLFKEKGLVKEKQVKNRKVISINEESCELKRIKSLINVDLFLNTKTYKKLKKLGKTGLYGSFASGENDPGSDIDMWIYTDKKEMEIRGLIREFESELKSKINLLVLNKEKLGLLKKKDPEFYIRLKLTSICLEGDIFD